jgi:hypothetical protein
MITNYKRARKDAEFLIGWAANQEPGDRHIEALAVMNTPDARAVILTALLHHDGKLPALPEDDATGGG